MCFSGLLIKDICTVFPADMCRQYYLTLSKGDPYSTYGKKQAFGPLARIMIIKSWLLQYYIVGQPNICLKNWDKLHGGLWAKR